MIDGYSRNKDLALPGFTAGPCLLKDTMQLSSFLKGKFQLGYEAMKINEGLPIFLIKKLEERLSIKNKNIGILGMSFKSETDDIRDSLSIKLRNYLRKRKLKYFCSDPYYKDDEIINSKLLIKKSDIIIVATPHLEYTNLRLPKNKVLVDVWGIIKKNSLLIIGGFGNLGQSIRKNIFFKNCHFPKKHKLNLLNKSQIKNFIIEKKIKCIINAAALARMSECENNKFLAYRTNVVGCRNLVNSIKEINKNIKLIHISTDGVYPSISGNYKENSKLKPYNYYGLTKLKAEKLVKDLENYLIIRTRFFDKNKIIFKTAAEDSFTSAIEVTKLVNIIKILIKKMLQVLLT